MDAAEVGLRPLSSNSSIMSEEEIAVQAIIDVNQQGEQLSSVNEKRPPPAKRLRINDSSDEKQCVDEDGFTLVQRKAIRVATRKLRLPTSVRGTDVLIDNSFEVCISSYQLLPKQIGLAMLLKAEGITNATQIKYKTPYRVVITFENKEDADLLILNKTFMESGYRCYMTNEVGISYGVVKYLELHVKEEDLMESLQCDQKILSIKRLNRMSEAGEWVKSETVRFGFKGATLPPYVFGYGCRFKVDPYTFPVTQCASCWKFGHLTRTCPTKKTCCPKCGRGHTNCETTEYRCINCKGKHMSLSKSCPVYLKEREIRSIMCHENCTYKHALSKYLEEKTYKFNEHFKNPPSFFKFGDRSTSTSYEPPTPKATMSYSQSVGAKLRQTEALKHLEPEVLYNDVGEISDVESMESSGENATKNARKQKNRRDKRDGLEPLNNINAASLDSPIMKAAGAKSTSEGTTNKTQKKTSDFSSIFKKVKDIVFSALSFEEKVSQVLKLLFDELMSFIVNMVSSGDVLTKLFGLFNDG